MEWRLRPLNHWELEIEWYSEALYLSIAKYPLITYNYSDEIYIREGDAAPLLIVDDEDEEWQCKFYFSYKWKRSFSIHENIYLWYV